MTTLKNWKFPVLAAMLAILALIYSGISPASPAVGLTPAEEKKMQYCEAGTEELDPHIAAECLNEKFLLDKLAKRDPNRFLRFTQKADIAKDFLDLLELHTEIENLRQALAPRLEPETPAAEFGLGPEPEKFTEWTAKYKKEKLDLARNAVRSWGTLTEDKTTWLKANGIPSDKWTALPLSSRNSTIASFAKIQAQELLKIPRKLDVSYINDLADKVNIISEDLDPETKKNLSDHFDRLKIIVLTKEKAAELLKTNQAGLKDFQAELESIKTLPVEDQLARLSLFFENAPELRNVPELKIINSARKSSPGEKLKNKDARAISLLLQTALLGEIKGTKAGDKAAKFFENKKRPLLLRITALDSGFAKYSSDERAIYFKKTMIEAWMKANNYTLRDLQTKPEALSRLARFLAPALVHEATHYDQDVWYESRDFVNPYVADSETEAMSVEALYVIEKTRKDPEFKKMLETESMFSSYMEEEAARAREFLENPRDFRKMIYRDFYLELHSFESAEAAYMSETGMTIILDELERRKKLSKKDQEKLKNSKFKDDGKKPLIEIAGKIATGDLIAARSYYLAWHAGFPKRIENHIAWADETLAEILQENPGENTPTVPSPGNKR